MKKIMAFAAAASILCTTASCSEKNKTKEQNTVSDRVMDLCEVYGDFFDYTFNGDYTIDVVEEDVLNEGTEYEQAYRKYDISYTRKDGVKRNTEIYSQEFTENEKESYASEQRMMNEIVNCLCYSEIDEACRKEIIENILSKYIDIEYMEDQSIYKTDEYSCSVFFPTPIYMFDEDYEGYEKGCELVDNHISPETGYKLSEADLKTFAVNKEYYLALILTIPPEADKQIYIDKMNAIIDDYFAYTGNPMNAQFVIRQGESSSVSIEKPFQKVFLMGEEINIEEKKKEDKNYRLNDDILRICVEEG